jgi:hypothetical protein
VRLLGYVYTSYAKRNVSAVRKDIQTYADWPTNSSNPNLAVRGIFFDETPQQYDAQTFTYLEGLTDFVKDLDGLGPDNFVSTIHVETLFFSLYIYSLPPYHIPVLHHRSWSSIRLSFFCFFFPSFAFPVYPRLTIPHPGTTLWRLLIPIPTHPIFHTDLQHISFPFWDT